MRTDIEKSPHDSPVEAIDKDSIVCHNA